MMTVSVEEAQRRWYELLDLVVANHEQVLITAESAAGVLIAAEDYNEQQTETLTQRLSEDASTTRDPDMDETR